MADYHAERPHELRRARYPDVRARRNFYLAYLTQRGSAAGATPSTATGSLPTDAELDALEGAVQAWSPASHAMWALWGIVQAREVVSGDELGEFDYLGYAASRMSLFRARLA
jgi:choline kinase